MVPNRESLVSISAEQCVLGCMLRDGLGADTAIAILKAEHFYSPEHQVVFEVITDQRRRNLEPDEVQAAIEISERGEMTEPTAALLLLECMQTVAHSAHVARYADEVLKKYQRRSGDLALRISSEKLSDPSVCTVEVLSDAVDQLQAVIAAGIEEKPQPASESIFEALTVEDAAKIPTGFSGIDQITGGLATRAFTVLGARPSQGKTALELEIGRRITQLGATVLFFSVEMDRRSILHRLGALEVGVPMSFIRDGRLGDQERAALERLQNADWMRRFLIDDQPRTVDEMTAITRLYARRFGVKAVMIDYLQLISPSNPRQPREQQIAEISRKLKQMAKTANVAVLCAAQLNRDVEKRDVKRPKISDLRESGSIEQDADQVWLLWRPAKDSDANDDHGELIVAKSRNGATGATKLAWHGPSMSYDNAGPETGASYHEPQLPAEWK